MANLNSNHKLARNLSKSTMTMDNMSRNSASSASSSISNTSNNTSSGHSHNSHSNLNICTLSNYRSLTNTHNQSCDKNQEYRKQEYHEQEQKTEQAVNNYTDDTDDLKQAHSKQIQKSSSKVKAKDNQQFNFDMPSYDIPPRHFMNGLLKHTAIALLIIIPLAAYSAFV